MSAFFFAGRANLMISVAPSRLVSMSSMSVVVMRVPHHSRPRVQSPQLRGRVRLPSLVAPVWLATLEARGVLVYL